ncbi:MAG: flagellar assembly protein FliW [Candidatus Omnitrophota bacterium]
MNMSADQSAACSKSGMLFPEGLIGFSGCKQYVIDEDKSKEPFFFLQSVENEKVGFIIINPKEFKSEYSVCLTDADKQALNVSSVDECDIFSIVFVPETSESMSVNLLAPLVVNKKSSIGRQVVLQDADYSVRHLILEEMFEGVKDKDVSSFAQTR